MGLRDILILGIVFGSIPFTLRQPYIGVLVWSWISYANPHRLAYGMAKTFPVAMVAALALFAALLFSKEPKKLPEHPIVKLWLVFIGWMTLTTIFAFHFDDASTQYIKIFKIQLITFIVLMIMNNEHRIRLMVWVIFLSIGFYGVKGGWHTIVTAGGGRVYGPYNSFIAENNALAVALLMIVPLGYYIFLHEVKKRWQKYAVLAALALIVFSILGSFSRGAFLAIFCSAFYLWLKSPKKLIPALVIPPLLAVAFTVMPQSYFDRIATIGTYEEDKSAMGRLNAWEYAINAANRNVFGLGLESWSAETFARYAPDPNSVHVAHSIYFSVLADHGWIGLIMFVSLFVGGWRLAGKIIKRVGNAEEDKWIADLARMIQVSFVAYGSGGAFLSLAYFDLPWNLLAIVILLHQLLENRYNTVKPTGSTENFSLTLKRPPA